MPREIDWYFDIVSGFAYLQQVQFDRFPADVTIRPRPVLFAGLLQHHGQLGPAEIPEKRRFTYRYWIWRAAALGVPFRLPPAHPFNPLRPLRLMTALDGDLGVVRRVLDFIWAEGRNPEPDDEWHALAEAAGVEDADARVADPAVKSALRAQTERAAERGLFGVPTLVIDGEIFWGSDATDMALEYLRDPALLASGEMVRVSNLPIATDRKR